VALKGLTWLLMIGMRDAPSWGWNQLMERILTAGRQEGSLANLMLVIGFGYKGA